MKLDTKKRGKSQMKEEQKNLYRIYDHSKEFDDNFNGNNTKGFFYSEDEESVYKQYYAHINNIDIEDVDSDIYEYLKYNHTLEVSEMTWERKFLEQNFTAEEMKNLTGFKYQDVDDGPEGLWLGHDVFIDLEEESNN